MLRSKFQLLCNCKLLMIFAILPDFVSSDDKNRLSKKKIIFKGIFFYLKSIFLLIVVVLSMIVILNLLNVNTEPLKYPLEAEMAEMKRRGIFYALFLVVFFGPFIEGHVPFTPLFRDVFAPSTDGHCICLFQVESRVRICVRLSLPVKWNFFFNFFVVFIIISSDTLPICKYTKQLQEIRTGTQNLH